MKPKLNDLFNETINDLAKNDINNQESDNKNNKINDNSIKTYRICEFKSNSWIFNNAIWNEFLKDNNLKKDDVLFLILFSPHCIQDQNNENDQFFNLIKTITASKKIERSINNDVYVEILFGGNIKDIQKKFVQYYGSYKFVQYFSTYKIMNFFLCFIVVQYFGSYKTNLLRRNYQLKVESSSSRLKLKNAEDSWYFVYFNTSPNFSLLSTHGIELKPKNMISKHWYSLFLTSKQVEYLSTVAIIRQISRTEKINDQTLIQFSESIVVETSSTFNPSFYIKKFSDFQLFVYKLSSDLYQIQSNDNANDEKIYSISPKNNTLFFNNRAAGYTQFKTKQYRLSGEYNDIIVIDRYLESKGLNGQDQVILVADTYLDPNSTYFYDPKFPLFEKNQYYSDHRKMSIIFEEYEYSQPHANEHGTHVSGCAAGSAYIESNWSLFDGVAPKAKIAFYQGGTSGVYNSDSVQSIVDKTHPCVSTNSWGRLNFDISSENIWNKNAKIMNDTLFIFSAGNIDFSAINKLDFYETVSSPGAGKNILTVGAL